MGNLLKKLAALRGRTRLDGELDEEMAFHPEQIEAELRGRGVGAEEAHFAVMRQFGNSPRIKERSHEEMRFWLEIVT